MGDPHIQELLLKQTSNDAAREKAKLAQLEVDAVLHCMKDVGGLELGQHGWRQGAQCHWAERVVVIKVALVFFCYWAKVPVAHGVEVRHG